MSLVFSVFDLFWNNKRPLHPYCVSKATPVAIMRLRTTGDCLILLVGGQRPKSTQVDLKQASSAPNSPSLPFTVWSLLSLFVPLLETQILPRNRMWLPSSTQVWLCHPYTRECLPPPWLTAAIHTASQWVVLGTAINLISRHGKALTSILTKVFPKHRSVYSFIYI